MTVEVNGKCVDLDEEDALELCRKLEAKGFFLLKETKNKVVYGS